MMTEPPPRPPRRRRNRPSMRALDVLRRARETAAAAAQAAAEAAALLRRRRNRNRNRRYRRYRLAEENSSRDKDDQRSTPTNEPQPAGTSVTKSEEPQRTSDYRDMRRSRPPGYWAKKRERRKLRRAAEAAAAAAVESNEMYYGPQDMSGDPYGYPPDFYPGEYPPAPPDYEFYGWSGARGYPMQPGPGFDYYNNDRMQLPVEPLVGRFPSGEYMPRVEEFNRASNGRNSFGPRAPQEARHFSAPFITPEPWVYPTHPYGARW